MTPKQADVIKMISHYQGEHEVSPIYTEIARAMRLSVGSVVSRLECLINAGHLTRRKHEARSLEIVSEQAHRIAGIEMQTPDWPEIVKQMCRRGREVMKGLG